MTGKELLLHHLDHTFEKEAMQTSLALAVRGLTAAQAAWKPSPDRHSIWQIARHLTHWKEGVIAALDGKPLDYEERNRTDWQDVAGAQRDWEADVERLAAISREIRARVDAMDDPRLTQGIKWYQQSREPRPILTRLLDVATHDIYHTGQIQYLFALQEIPVEELAAAAGVNDVSRLERILQMANTPLHLAVTGIGHRPEKATLLIQHGADLAARDASGSTPLDLARDEGDAELIGLIQAAR